MSKPNFHYAGTIPASKSLLNRWLIIQSYAPELTLHGDSQCDDVVYLRKALAALHAGENTFHCGAGGTTLRFFALRAAREVGEFTITGDARLFARPQTELLNILEQLGVHAKLRDNSLRIQSEGWKIPETPVMVNCEQSSQFASALLLNTWQLDTPLTLQLTDTVASQHYYEMTLATLKQAGLQCNNGDKHHCYIIAIEPDMSSAFAVASLATVAGSAELQNFPVHSIQPDAVFPEVLREMGAAVSIDGSTLHVERAAQLKPIRFALSNCPDLFPVLAVLCAAADGRSHLHGAPQLKHKESNRIAKVSELLTAMQINHEAQTDGMIIHGCPEPRHSDSIAFDPDEDHRLVMAAYVAEYLGYNIKLTTTDPISKSFPEFLKIVRN